MRMYDYSKSFIELEQLLASGTIDFEQYQDTLESIEGDANEKAGNVAKMIENFQAQAKMLKEEEDLLKKKRKTLENKVDWLTGSLENYLVSLGKQEHQIGIHRLTYDKLPDVVEIKNEKALPRAYKLVETVIKPDKKLIIKHLKDGETVRGATLITGRTKFKVKKI